jgi:hypothetical protein
MKNMEIIMLIGKPNKGKTASLTFVHEILVAYGAETTLVERIGSEDQRDFSSVLIYRGKKIRIFTMGDVGDKKSREELWEALNEKKFDFFICACNIGHSEFIKKATQQPIEKTDAKINAYSNLEANWYDASKIIELLFKIIGKRRKA